MQIIAVVSEDAQEAKESGLGVGPLARAGVSVVRVIPEDSFVERLVLQMPPDLILLDADLPGYQPFAAIKILRKFSSFMLVPLFAVSKGDRSEEARTAGATQFLRKPVQSKDLEEALHRHVKPVIRKAPRKGLAGPCVVSKGGMKFEGRISDVSISGAQVAIKEELPLGVLVQVGFAIVMQGTPHIIRTSARVARQIPGGYGLAFTALDQEARGLIQIYTKG